MKKLLLISLIFALLAGCNANKGPSQTAVPLMSPNVEEREYKIIERDNNNEQYKSLNKFESCAYDFDHDDVEENITLYTSADKDESGQFMWDDSQDWVLAVEGNNGAYTLYENHERGVLELYVSEYYKEGGEEPAIRLVISTSSCFEIREYTYRDGKYLEEIVYNAGDLNELSVNKY